MTNALVNDGPGLEIRMLDTNDDIAALVAVFDEIWRPDPGNRPVSTDMLRALIHSGNYVSGAYLDGALVGGSVGFFGSPVGLDLHSHMAGVSAAGRGRNVGYALKVHQRDWALDRGIEQITWTFDPLVARNAFFNLGKLGAVPTSYHRDFYGDIGDELGGADESDRLLVTWHLADPRPAIAADVKKLAAAGAVHAIDDSDPGVPRVLADQLDADVVVVSIPADIETMRRENPEASARWRFASRAVLERLLADGERSASFDRSGRYVFAKAGALR